MYLIRRFATNHRAFDSFVCPTCVKVNAGLVHMLSEALPWSEERRLRQKQIVCWYQKQSISEYKTVHENIDVLEYHFNSGSFGPDEYPNFSPVSFAPVDSLSFRL